MWIARACLSALILSLHFCTFICIQENRHLSISPIEGSWINDPSLICVTFSLMSHCYITANVRYISNETLLLNETTLPCYGGYEIKVIPKPNFYCLKDCGGGYHLKLGPKPACDSQKMKHYCIRSRPTESNCVKLEIPTAAPITVRNNSVTYPTGQVKKKASLKTEYYILFGVLGFLVILTCVILTFHKCRRKNTEMSELSDYMITANNRVWSDPMLTPAILFTEDTVYWEGAIEEFPRAVSMSRKR